MTSVTLTNGKIFDANGEQTILDAALRQNVFLEYSCRTGRCGICKTKVVKGETDTIKPEESLTELEKADGEILTCCRVAVTDVSLEAEDLGALVDYPAKTVPCRINSLTKLTDDVVEVILRLPPGQPLKFLAGQYVDVIGRGGIRRSYSIANAPRQDGCIVLYIKRVEAGEMSHYWFNEASSNDLLRLEGPLGTFFFRDNAPGTIVLLATGTGIAPVKALLEDLDANPGKVVDRRVLVFWGNRHQKDLFWKPQFENIDVYYTPVLSRAGDEWSGASGYVQDTVIERELEMDDLIVYACGSEEMIHSAQELLFERGLSAARFYSDAFVSSN